jgi:hypothetical protein
MKTNTDALEMALMLAITAPDDERAERATELAKDMSRYMTQDEIRNAKRRVTRKLEKQFRDEATA